jgi:hypothetical protein
MPDAKPGETMQNYMRRMDVEGKRVNLEMANKQIEHLRGQIVGLNLENKFKPQVIQSQIAAQQSSAAANAENIAASRQQRQQGALTFEAQKNDLAGQELASVLGKKGVDPQQASAEVLKKYGIAPTQQALIAVQNKAQGYQASATTQSKITQLALPQNAMQAKIATAAMEKANNYGAVISNLKSLADTQGFGMFWNDEKANQAKQGIIDSLYQLGQQNPAFASYAKQLESPGFMASFDPSQAKKVVADVQKMAVKELKQTVPQLQDPEAVRAVNQSIAALEQGGPVGGFNPFGGSSGGAIVMGQGQSQPVAQQSSPAGRGNWQQPFTMPQGRRPTTTLSNELDAMLGGRQ